MRIAYLMAKSVDEHSWSGGMLITDERGLPLDFRYVEPIRPGKLQKLIYGDALERYLILEAITSPLIKAADTHAEWYFTSDPLLLDLNGLIKGRFISVKNGERASLKEPGEYQIRGTGDVLFQASKTGAAVNLRFKSDSRQNTEEVVKDLQWLSEQFDFTEPLDRVDSALREICRGRID